MRVGSRPRRGKLLCGSLLLAVVLVGSQSPRENAAFASTDNTMGCRYADKMLDRAGAKEFTLAIRCMIRQRQHEKVRVAKGLNKAARLIADDFAGRCMTAWQKQHGDRRCSTAGNAFWHDRYKSNRSKWMKRQVRKHSGLKVKRIRFEQHTSFPDDVQPVWTAYSGYGMNWRKLSRPIRTQAKLNRWGLASVRPRRFDAQGNPDPPRWSFHNTVMVMVRLR